MKHALMLWLISAQLTLAADTFVRLPSPAGMLDGAGLSPKLRAMATAGQLPGEKTVGLYYPTNALAEILNDGSTAPCPMGKAILKKHSSVSEARTKFQILVTNAKKEGDRSFDPNDPAIKRIFRHYENATRKVEPGISVSIRGMSILGTILDKETVYAGCAIGNYNWSDGQSQADLPFAMSVAWMRFGRDELEIAIAYPFKDASSVSYANRKLLDWIEQIEKQNK